MFVKQIDLKEALRLAHKDQEVKILVPSPEGDWDDMYPTTLQGMLNGCLFFRQEPAMEKSGFEGAFHAAEATMPTQGIDKSHLPMSMKPGPPPHADGAVAKPSGSTQEPTRGRMGTGAKRQKVDTGKLLALHKAGWTNAKIADEMGVSGVTVGNYLKKLEGERDEGRNSNG